MNPTIKVITDNSGIDRTKWNDFIASQPNANFFQSPGAFQFFQAVENYQPLLVIAEENNQIVGSLLAVLIRDGKGLKGYFSRRCIVWGGPLVRDKNAQIAEKILKKFDNQVNHRAIYSQFRNLFDVSDFKEQFILHGYSFEEHLNIIVDLTKSEDELWSEVHQKRRNEIRRAEKEGTEFQLLNNRDTVSETFEILKEVYSRAKLPLPKLEFFVTAFDQPGQDHFRIFVALNEGKIIGTMYALCYRDTIYDWYAGSYQEYYKKYPNDLIPWKVFLWGKENGYRKFDFGGAGKPGVPYGVRDYKKKFGGEQVNYGRFVRINNPFLYQAGRIGLNILGRIR